MGAAPVLNAGAAAFDSVKFDVMLFFVSSVDVRCRFGVLLER